MRMENLASQLKRGISRQFSTGSLKRSLSRQFTRQSSLDPRRNNLRFSFGRQSSLDPIRRRNSQDEMSVPENLDSTMQLLFMACRGDVKGVEDLLNEGIDVNSIDLDGRTALHIAACEGHVEVVKLLLSRKANIDARDRWGSTAAADAKYYGNVEVYEILKARGAKVPKTRKTPMTVANPHEVPEYELNPMELQIRKSDGITKGSYQVAKWNGTRVSVKILDKDSYSDPESINAFKYELTLLEKVRHPNVVQFVGAVTQNIPMMIVSEYHAKGNFQNYLQKKGRLSTSKVLRFAVDIARGMNYLHECKPDPIIHCNLQPKNVLLDNGGKLKIAGFGLLRLSKLSADKAKLARPDDQLDPSNIYMAPEIHKDMIFDRSVDAYSFGVMLYEMIEGVPFHPKPAEEAVKLMCFEQKRPPLKIKSKSCPTELRELIGECWDPEPLIRPTFSEIIVRLERIVASCTKQGWWKDAFKLPWYGSIT
ncbi:hypothetical protein J1N35_012937 [Gossypium stocksii]|uniref:non-specific serine/threonine protein kinase n=1 Tax=Gossypium stocksii TaxID=47602 RepID=A0A9D3VTZ0_9ROSI|nr:hypothetical protein J1N35_012937 [Gossypium stocksii]